MTYGKVIVILHGCIGTQQGDFHHVLKSNDRGLPSGNNGRSNKTFTVFFGKMVISNWNHIEYVVNMQKRTKPSSFPSSLVYKWESHLLSSPSMYSFFFFLLSWADCLLRIFRRIFFRILSSYWLRGKATFFFHFEPQKNKAAHDCFNCLEQFTFVRGSWLGRVTPSFVKSFFSSSLRISSWIDCWDGCGAWWWDLNTNIENIITAVWLSLFCGPQSSPAPTLSLPRASQEAVTWEQAIRPPSSLSFHGYLSGIMVWEPNLHCVLHLVKLGWGDGINTQSVLDIRFDFLRPRPYGHPWFQHV